MQAFLSPLLKRPSSPEVESYEAPEEAGPALTAEEVFRAYGSRVVGVILSGALDDGSAGLAAIKRRGGVAIVQDPAEALYSGMPRSALENVSVDHVLPLAEIAPRVEE